MIKTILVVEDDLAISDLLTMLLTCHQYQVVVAKDYSQAIKYSEQKEFHLVLLDWMLPGGSGIQFIKHLKKHERTQSIPIIMLTAKQQESDQIMGLDVGADDYITKPFSNNKLLARINALLRRSYPEQNNQLLIDGLELDLASHRVFGNKKEINLGPIEYKLLQFLMSKPDRVFSRDQIIDYVWGNDAYIDDRTIDVHIGRLRKQLESAGYAQYIQTVRGTGYRFSAKVK